MPKLIYLDEISITLEKFEEKLTSEKEKKAVFVFPGNPGHHKEGVTLSSIKKGGGLASVAMTLGEKNYPTLSLPTTGMTGLSSTEGDRLAEKAMIDLYRAIGAGYSIVLPVRPYRSGQVFNRPLSKKLRQPPIAIEPSFWGGINKDKNPDLAAYYIDKLVELETFLAAPEGADRDALFEKLPDEFKQAFRQGVTESATDWQVTVPSVPKKEHQASLPKKEYLAVIEGKDPLGFVHDIIPRSQLKTQGNPDISVRATGALTKKEDLSDDHVYRARQVFSAPSEPLREAMLVQDNTGRVKDYSKNLTADEKRKTAIAMATMFLQSHDPKDSIIIDSQDKEMAGMVHAALLAMNSALTVTNNALADNEKPNPTNSAAFIDKYFPQSEDKSLLNTATQTYTKRMDDFKQSLPKRAESPDSERRHSP